MSEYIEFAKVLGALAMLYPRFALEDRTVTAQVDLVWKF